MKQTVAALLGLLGGALWSPVVAAESEGLHIDAGLYTDFPLAVGARSTLELPSRLRFSASVASFPDPYLDAIQGVATSAGWYSDSLATLIDKALSKAWLLHLQVGYRPLKERGFFFTGGFMPVLASGAEASSEEVSSASEDTDQDYYLESHLQLVTVQAGWEWTVKERLMVRGALGGAFTVAANSEATAIQDGVRAGLASDVARGALETYLDQTYKSYVHTPTFGLELAWRVR